MTLLPLTQFITQRRTWSIVIAILFTQSSSAMAFEQLFPQTTTQSSTTNGTNVTDSTYTDPYTNGFTVSGGFTVTAAASGDVVINLDTVQTYAPTSYQNGSYVDWSLLPGTYGITAEIGATFADLGSSGNGVGTATSVDFDSTTFLSDASQNLVWGSSTSIDLTEPLPNGQYLQGSTSTDLFNFGGGTAYFEQDTTITFHGVAAGDVLYFNLPNGGTISPHTAPEPTSLALAGVGGIGMIVGAYRRRRNKSVPVA